MLSALIRPAISSTLPEPIRQRGANGAQTNRSRQAGRMSLPLLNKGLLGLQTGQGFYSYPNPRYADPDFLDVPEVARTDEFASLALPRK